MQHQVNLRGTKTHQDTIRDMMAKSAHLFSSISRGGTQWVYGGRLFIVSATTNKRHHQQTRIECEMRRQETIHVLTRRLCVVNTYDTSFVYVVRLFWRQKADTRGVWAGCSKTAEIIPSSTTKHTNRAERCTCTPARGPAWFLIQGRNSETRFYWIVLVWKKIRSEMSLKYAKSETSPRLLPVNEKISIGNSPGHEHG